MDRLKRKSPLWFEGLSGMHACYLHTYPSESEKTVGDERPDESHVCTTVPFLEPYQLYTNTFVCGPDDFKHELARQELVARVHTETNRLTDQRIRCRDASEQDRCNAMSECYWQSDVFHPETQELRVHRHCAWKGR